MSNVDPVPLLFLHDSVGEQLLADAPGTGRTSQHPNGGGLRRALEARSFRVHDARRLSGAGDHIGLFDWLPTFHRMDEVLRLGPGGATLPRESRNRVVLFKSCFTYNWFVGAGEPPGEPSGPVLTEANARATLRALLPLFQAQPDVLFVYLTAPPLADLPEEPVAKRLLKRALAFPSRREKLRSASAIARRFNDWAATPDGWLAGYALSNVAVFHLFDVLTGGAAATLSRYASGDGHDSHPSAEGNAEVTRKLVPFIQRAVAAFFRREEE
jgi:hypothetical protein